MTKKRPRRHVTWQDAMSICAWCGRHIPEDSEVFALGAKVRPGVELEHEGNVITLALTAMHRAYAIVPAEDSEAKRAGWDLIFTVCSKECGRKLRQSVQGQIDLADRILKGFHAKI